MSEIPHAAGNDAPPEWCPRDSACMYPECLLLVEKCASALMASDLDLDPVFERQPKSVTRYRATRVIPPAEPQGGGDDDDGDGAV